VSDRPIPDSAIDWDALKERIARASSGLGERRTREQASALLDSRARALARVEATPEAEDPNTFDALAFVIADETYALSVRVVRTVLPSVDVVSVPLAPEVLVGVANLRGEVLPVFDLARLLGLAPAARSNGSAKVVVIGEERQEMAIVVDGLLDVRRVAPASLGELGSASPLVRGITPDALLVLDEDAVLGDERLVVDVDRAS